MATKKITLEQIMKKDFIELQDSISFELGLTLMEELTTAVESGSMPLEQTITAYQRGTELLEHLDAMLGDAEKKLEIKEVK